MGKFEDLTGRKFGYLKVIQYDHSDKQGTHWLCECKCKNKVIVRRSHLISGHTKSCGCFIKDFNSCKKLINNYDLTGDYGVAWTTNNNEKFYFDIKDYERIKDYCWLEHDGYIVSSTGVFLHRLILFADEKNMETVDHIDHNTKDNRKSNLREASYGENNRNRGLLKNNVLGLRGIYRFENGSYRATIVKDGMTYSKTNKDLDFIIEWRRKKEIELFGEFAFRGGD